MIILNSDLLGNGIVVGTVVGDVQFPVAVDECQVAFTVQTACMACTQSNQVAVIDIVDRGSGITED